MSIVRYHGWPNLNRLHTELNRLLDAPSNTHAWRPAVDIQELDDKFSLSVDLPGVDPNNIDITVEKNVLTISGERNTTETKEEQGYTRFERRSGSFSRRFTLPDNVDGDAVTARGNNGVLTVDIPKVAAAQPKKITVAAA